MRLLLFFFTLFILGCSGSDKNQENKKLKIVCTTGIIADGIANIVGEHAEVEPLMGPGVDPHLYKASAGDLQKLRSADIIFYNGLHLEGKMGDVLKKFSVQKPVYALADALNENDLINTAQFKTSHDPHIWFDVLLWKKCMKYISIKIMETDTANSAFYRSESETYCTRLDDLHNNTLNKINTIPQAQRILITTHDAFSYFGRAYDIKVKALQGISTASEFGLKDITELVDYISENKIKSVFVESSVSEKSLQAVIEGCESKEHKVAFGGKIYADALGEKDSNAGTYIKMVSTNVQTIVTALGQRE